MALKRIRVKMATETPTNGGSIPVVPLKGDMVTRYNEAVSQKKAAEDIMADLRGILLEVGHGEIYSRSCADPDKPVHTVKLQDQQGEVARVEFTSRYGAVAENNVDELDDLFKARKLDINDYVQETVAATFDCNVFLDSTGQFKPSVYQAFREALESTAARLNLACPLETKKVVVPKPMFHVERFRLFEAGAQETVTRLMPNTSRIVPVTVKVAQ